jgi:hypothetical protein
LDVLASDDDGYDLVICFVWDRPLSGFQYKVIEEPLLVFVPIPEGLFRPFSIEKPKAAKAVPLAF